MILAKAADLEQIEVKEKIGCDGIEVQLLSDFVKMSNMEIGCYADTLIGHNVRTIHVPLVTNETCSIEWLCLGPDTELFDRICALAECIATNDDSIINVICHSNLNMHHFDYGGMIDKIAERIKAMLEQYPHINIDIENVIPVQTDSRTEEIIITNNGFTDTFELCKALRERLNTERIGLVLDTSHALSTVRMLKNFCNYCNITEPEISLYGFCKLYAPFLHVIHFSRTIADGITPSRHGQPFICGMYDDVKILLDVIGESVDLNNTYITLEEYQAAFS